MKCGLCNGGGWVYDYFVIVDKITGEEIGLEDGECPKCNGTGVIECKNQK